MSTELAEVNLGKIDRGARLAIGLATIALFITSPLPALVGLVGLVIALTAVIGFCPLYALVGLSTCRSAA